LARVGLVRYSDCIKEKSLLGDPVTGEFREAGLEINEENWQFAMLAMRFASNPWGQKGLPRGSDRVNAKLA
jgi:hypothetical protein